MDAHQARMRQVNAFFAQRGLAYFPDFAVYSTFSIEHSNLESYELWQTLARELDALCSATSFRTTVILGVGFETWTAWSEEMGWTLPVGMGTKRKLDERAQVFGNSGGDLWFHIKAATR